MDAISAYLHDLPLADTVNAVVALGLGAVGHVAWGALKDYVRGHKTQIEHAALGLAEDICKAEIHAAEQHADTPPGDAPALTREEPAA